MERARNRGSSQRKHVNCLFELFDFLLVFNTKTMLLINYKESEIVKLYRFGEQAVGANNDVYSAFCQSFLNLLYFLRCPEPV